MKNTIIRLITAAFVCCIILTGCEQKPEKEIGHGAIKGEYYTNDYLQLKVKIPSDWAIQNREVYEHVMETGRQLVFGDDKDMETLLKASEQRAVSLFMVFRHPLGTPVDYNPNIAAVAEKVKMMPGIKSGKDYLFHVKKTLEKAQSTYDFPNEVYANNKGGFDFDVLDAEASIGAVEFKQKYYASIVNGYALVVIISYSSPEGEKQLMDIINSIEKTQK